MVYKDRFGQPKARPIALIEAHTRAVNGDGVVVGRPQRDRCHAQLGPRLGVGVAREQIPHQLDLLAAR